MRPLVAKIKPVRGFTYLLHWGLVLLLPLAVYVFVRTHVVPLALILILLSKWRMLAVRPRFWLANIRSNAIDIVVGLSALAFMTHTTSSWWQLIWALFYTVWLVIIKPGTTIFMSSLQAGIGFAVGLSALYMLWSAAPLYGLVVVTGMLCYIAARHFFDSYDEPYAKLLAYLWAYFGAALVFLFGHAMFFYVRDTIAQVTVLLVCLGAGLGTLYYFDHHDRLHRTIRYECLGIMVVVTLLIMGDFIYKMFSLTHNL